MSLDLYVEEIRLLTFDFGPTCVALGMADTNLGTPAFTLRALGAGAPIVILSSQVQGLKQFLFIQGGEPGIIFDCRCSASFSNGERITLRDFIRVQ